MPRRWDEIVEKFWGGDALEVVGLDGEATDDGIGDVGHQLFDHPPCALGVRFVLLPSGEEVDCHTERAEDHHGIGQILHERDDEVVDAGISEPVCRNLGQQPKRQKHGSDCEELVAIETSLNRRAATLLLLIMRK